LPAGQPRPIRVFLDSDVLLAGSASTTGASHLILQLSELGLIDTVASEQARREVERNLERKLSAALPAFRLLAEAAVRWVDDAGVEDEDRFRGQADDKDMPILVAAVRDECQTLLTFNVRHYKPGGGAIRIERPGDFLGRLREHLAALPA
jgi:predicted nucleic acid-binding protein